MKKLFKILSLLRLVRDLRGHGRHYGGGHYGGSHHGGGHWHPQPRAHHYPPHYGARRRHGRLREALRVLLGRRGY
jgi:hypothetical protein